MDTLSIEIRGIPSVYSKFKLSDFLKKCPGGGNIEKIIKDGSKTQVRFGNSEDLKAFRDGGPYELEFGGKHQLEILYPKESPSEGIAQHVPYVYQYRPLCDLSNTYQWSTLASMGLAAEPGARGLLVQNTGDNTQLETIKKYFESEKHSHGGLIKSIVKMHDGILIFFEDETKIDAVLETHSRKAFTFPNGKLKLYPKIFPKIFSDRIVIEILEQNSGATIEETAFNLTLSIESTNNSIDVLDCHPCGLGTFLVKFETSIGPTELHDLISKLNSEKDDKRASILLRSDVLSVKGDDITSLPADTLNLFFSNKKRSGGGPVTLVKRSKNNTFIHFSSYEDAENAEHFIKDRAPFKIQDIAIEVNLYYDCLNDEDSPETDEPKEEGDLSKKPELEMYSHPVTQDDEEILEFAKDSLWNVCKDTATIKLSGHNLVEFTPKVEMDTATSIFKMQEDFETFCRQSLDEFFSQYAVEQKTFVRQMLENGRCFHVQLEPDYYQRNPSRNASVRWTSNTVKVVGVEKEVKSIIENLTELVEKYLIEDIHIPDDKFQMIEECNVWNDLMKNVNSHVKCIRDQQTLRMCGNEIDIKLGRMWLENYLKSSSKVPLTKTETEKLAFLKQVLSKACNSNAKKFILDKFHGKNIQATLKLSGDNVYLTSFEELPSEKCTEALEILEAIILVHLITLDEAKKNALKENKWNELIKELSENSCVYINMKSASINLVGLKNLIHDIKPRVEDFFQKNVTQEKIIKACYGKAKFIVERSSDFSSFSCQQKGIKTALTHRNGGGISMRGKIIALDQAEKDISRALQCVKEKTEIMVDPGAHEYFHSEAGRTCINNTEVLCECTILKDSPNCEEWQIGGATASSRAALSIKSEPISPLFVGILAKKKLSVKVSIWKNDLTDHACEAIVNPTDGKFSMGGKLSENIILKGGNEILRSAKQKKIHIGDAIITGAGNLKSCKKIIHVAVPRYQSGDRDAQKKLQSCVFEAMKIADKNKLKIIAFPALCCGKADLREIKEIVQLLFESLQDYIAETAKCSVEEVQFVEFENQNVIDEMKRLANENCRPYVEQPLQPTVNVEVSKNQAANVQTLLILGSIADQSADVIVNTIVAAHVNTMKGGAVSNALRRKCGSSVLNECSSLKKPFNSGMVLETSGGNLNCKKLYHAITSEWNPRKSEEVVREIVSNCMKKADRSGFKTLAFPAIGTGGFKYPPDKVSSWMRDEISSFSGLCLNQVIIVLYPSDQRVCLAFESAFKQAALSQGNQTAAIPHAVSSSLPESSHSQSQSTKYGDVTVAVYQGDITEEKSDAIVNSTNMQFDLSSGSVSGAILKKGGKTIQDELNGTKQRQKTFKVSSGGMLPCKKIIHAYFPDPSNIGGMSMEDSLLNVLMEADRLGMNSISIPALGTGNKSWATANVATIMADCFLNFSKKSVSNIRCINVVVFESSMLDDFQSCITKSPSKSQSGLKGLIKGAFSSWKNYWNSDVKEPSDTDTAYSQKASKEFKLYLYSDKERNLQEALKSLHGELSKISSRQSIDLSSYDVDMSQCDIEYLQNKYDVKIEKHTTRFLQELIIGGLTEKIVKALPSIREYIQIIAQATKSAKLVIWKHSDDGSNWNRFSETDSLALEQEYQKKNLPEYKVYAVNLSSRQMCKVDFESNILFLDPPCELLRQEVFETFRELPPDWETAEDGKKGVIVQKNSKEYQDVTENLSRLNYFANILSVKRIQNEQLYSQFMSKKVEVEKKLQKYNTNNPVVRKLYHGTTCADDILENGFDKGFAGKNATFFGRGVYFAVSPKYSHRYTSKEKGVEKTLFLADVITGDFCQGSENMVAPPSRSATNKTELYDSLVNDPNQPTIFVVFKDASVYPKYLITYKYDEQ
ncbi:protein mono-ADP-ribosyltransferase PARP14-like [Styela clava]